MNCVMDCGVTPKTGEISMLQGLHSILMAGTVTRLQRNYGISTDSNLSTWYNELPLRFGLCSRKVAVFTEPSEMYQQLMVCRLCRSLVHHSASM